jgi:tRNA pseudouridine55 synthase
VSLRPPPEERPPLDRLSFGVVNLDKPAGPSAHQVAAWVRDLAGVDRAAHGGTLDPKVTGCLPVLLGDATRCARVFLEAPKTYVAVLEAHAPLPGDFGAVVDEFVGEIYQRPPKRSAVRRRLRTRTVHRIDVLDRERRRALLRIGCESGTYVRKLCHDIGLALGTGAHMGALRRTAAGAFDDRDLVTLHDLADGLAFAREDDDPGLLDDVVRPAEAALAGLPRVTIARSAASEVANGAPVYAPGVLDAERPGDGGGTGEVPLVACHTPDGSAVCLGRLVGDPAATEGIVVDLERVLV